MLILYKIKILVIKKNILEGNSNHPLLCYHIVKLLWTVGNVNYYFKPCYKYFYTARDNNIISICGHYCLQIVYVLRGYMWTTQCACYLMSKITQFVSF